MTAAHLVEEQTTAHGETGARCLLSFAEVFCRWDFGLRTRYCARSISAILEILWSQNSIHCPGDKRRLKTWGAFKNPLGFRHTPIAILFLALFRALAIRILVEFHALGGLIWSNFTFWTL